MTINLQMPDICELKPRIVVFGVGGGGGNAVNNMIRAGLQGVDFVVANTDAQALSMSHAERVIQMGVAVTEGLGAGSQPEVGRAAAEEVLDEINDHLSNTHMAFITAGMGGGTGTGAAPVVARAARESGILTVGVVTKPFHFEGKRRLALADAGIEELQKYVDTLIVIPNQNLFRIANEKTTFADAFAMADQVLYSGVACITDLMVKEGLINLDFADVRSVMREMGKAMMGTGEAGGDSRAVQAAESAIANPLLDDVSMRGAKGLLISITGGKDLTLFEVDEAASRIREEVDDDANIILGATFDETMEGVIRVSVVATGIDSVRRETAEPADIRMTEVTQRLHTSTGIDRVPTQSANQTQQPSHIQQNAQTLTSQATHSTTLEQEIQVAQSAMSTQRVPQHPSQQVPNPQFVSSASNPTQTPTQAPQNMYPGNVHPQAQNYVPPQPVTPENSGKRMPRVEDFPAVAQRQIHARNGGGDIQNKVDDDRRPVGLLRRLANVGLGRQDNEAKPAQPQAQLSPQPGTIRPVQQPLQTAQPNYVAQQNGPQQATKGQLDTHGRASAIQQTSTNKNDEEQLEIPAFLRRQAN